MASVRPSSPVVAVISLVLLALGVTGCTGGSADEATDEGPTPAEVLADAKDTLDSTPGLRLSLTTDDLPQGVAGILGAEGVGTRAPAFEGDLTVSLSGQSVTVPVVAVDDVVYAQMPFTTGFSKVDPKAYGAPDPAQLLAPDSGFPALLTATDDLAAGDSVRGGSDNTEVLTEYTGTVSGQDMKSVIPSASGDRFDVAWQVTDDGELRQATLTGEFYPSTPSMTYTVDFTDYGTEQEITKP